VFYAIIQKYTNMDRKRFDLSTKISGKSAIDYMSELISRNERHEIEIERGKLSVAVLKQMNNRSRLLLDAAKFELKEHEVARAELLNN
jgi:hypothetical protein